MTQGDQKKIWVTMTGLPLTIKLEWPFHRSTSGADFWVLHGDIRLENSDGLHAPVAVKIFGEGGGEVAPLGPQDAGGPAVQDLRQEMERGRNRVVEAGEEKAG